MAGYEKILFLQAVEKEVFTIKEIVDKYGISANTARIWVKGPTIKVVPGSYPYRYTHKSNKNVADVSVGPDHGECIKLHVVTTEQLDAAIPNLMNSGTTLGESLSGITSERDLLAFEAKMISAIQVARRYYEKDVKD